ncbi:MAG: hypothetical protein EXQ79_09015 [Acidimicrobiia bacterium]|nr:hypothetical protein [Acidimicrobiia bacterium]
MRKMAIAIGTVLSLTLAVSIGTGAASVGTAKSGKVKVILSEWIANPKPKKIAAGKIKITAKNLGAEDHEVVVVLGDDAAALPVDADGAVVEDELAEGAFVDEIEDIAAGTSKSKKFKLNPGTYVVFCNVTETDEGTGEVESHFAEGMHGILKVS